MCTPIEQMKWQQVQYREVLTVDCDGVTLPLVHEKIECVCIHKHKYFTTCLCVLVLHVLLQADVGLGHYHPLINTNVLIWIKMSLTGRHYLCVKRLELVGLYMTVHEPTH